MDWTDYLAKRERVKDFVREAERERLARQVPRAHLLPDIRCWASSRLNYAVALIRYAWARLRHAPSTVEKGPAVADCN